MKFKYIRAEGEIIPSFYYGIIYKDWVNNTELYCIMPINFIIRIGRNIRWWWARKIQHRLSRYDYSVRILIKKIIMENNESYLAMMDEKRRYCEAYLIALKQCQYMNEMFPKELKQDLSHLYKL